MSVVLPQVWHDSQHSYTVVQTLGSGAGAYVYECTVSPSSPTTQDVAVKIPFHQDLRARNVLLNEIHIMKGLCHGNIVGFVCAIRDENISKLVMELCGKGSLKKMAGRISDRDALFYTCEIAKALVYLHGGHIIHHDVKLGNVLLHENGQVKLCDFGLATKLKVIKDQPHTHLTSVCCGTPNYVAPEIITSSHDHSYAVDVWSLGCTLYAMLHKTPPFQMDSLDDTYAMIRTATYKTPPSQSPTITCLLERMIVVDAAKRMTSSEIVVETASKVLEYASKDLNVTP